MVNIVRLGPPVLLGLLAALGPAKGEEAPRLLPGAATAAVESPNQQLAEAIGRRLSDSALIKGCRIEVIARSGTIELTGTVADSHQRDEAVRLTQGTPGVAKVINRLTVPNGSISPSIRPAQFGIGEPPSNLPAFADEKPPPQEPLPSFRAPMPPPGQPGLGQGPPPLPPYAWPTYAPYNNYSRVAYPSCYPYEAFPYLGPLYPFPKVPLGWRKVLLEFDDGFWWLSSHSQKRNYWQLKYW